MHNLSITIYFRFEECIIANIVVCIRKFDLLSIQYFHLLLFQSRRSKE